MSDKTKAAPTAPEAAAPAEELKHFWMVNAGIQFPGPQGQPAGAMANVLTSTPEAKFNHEAFALVHREFARQVTETHGVNPNDIRSINVQNICYLGHMTPSEMFGPEVLAEAAKQDEQAKKAH